LQLLDPWCWLMLREYIFSLKSTVHQWAFWFYQCMPIIFGTMYCFWKVCHFFASLGTLGSMHGSCIFLTYDFCWMCIFNLCRKNQECRPACWWDLRERKGEEKKRVRKWARKDPKYALDIQHGFHTPPLHVQHKSSFNCTIIPNSLKGRKLKWP
jgi:hypothetical protein